MKNKTREEAYLEMLKPAETISFKVLNCVDDLSAVRETPGDGFYIRSLEKNETKQSKVDHSLWLQLTSRKSHFCNLL